MKNTNYILVVFSLNLLVIPPSIFSQDIIFEHFSTEEGVVEMRIGGQGKP